MYIYIIYLEKKETVKHMYVNLHHRFGLIHKKQRSLPTMEMVQINSCLLVPLIGGIGDL